MAAFDARPARVLVVDDNHDTAETLGFLLAHAGYEVQNRFDGKSALVAAEEFEPDACVLDINMPGMSGYELAGAAGAVPGPAAGAGCGDGVSGPRSRGEGGAGRVRPVLHQAGRPGRVG